MQPVGQLRYERDDTEPDRWRAHRHGSSVRPTPPATTAMKLKWSGCGSRPTFCCRWRPRKLLRQARPTGTRRVRQWYARPCQRARSVWHSTYHHSSCDMKSCSCSATSCRCRRWSARQVGIGALCRWSCFAASVPIASHERYWNALGHDWRRNRDPAWCSAIVPYSRHQGDGGRQPRGHDHRGTRRILLPTDSRRRVHGGRRRHGHGGLHRQFDGGRRRRHRHRLVAGWQRRHRHGRPQRCEQRLAPPNHPRHVGSRREGRLHRRPYRRHQILRRLFVARRRQRRPHLVKGGLLGQTREAISEATTRFHSADQNSMWPRLATRGMRARLLVCTASLRLRPLSFTFLTLPPPCPRCIHPAEVSHTLLWNFATILICRAQRTSTLRRLVPPFLATRSGISTFAHKATYQQWLFF